MRRWRGQWHSARALVYYQDTFISADVDLMAQQRPPIGLAVESLPKGWHGFPEVVREFLRCRIGGRNKPPLLLSREIVVAVYGMPFSEELERTLRQDGYEPRQHDPRNGWIVENPDKPQAES